MPDDADPWHADSGVLVTVDLSGIQEFIYEGRRLLDAIGRSVMVADLTDTDPANPDGIGHLLTGLGPRTVLRDAGGALTVAFAAPEDARTFTAHYTRYLHDVSDLFRPVVAHVAFGPDQPTAPTLAAAEDELQHELSQVHQERAAAHTPVLGYGVTALCDVTGRPAETVDHLRGRSDRHERVARDVVHARYRGRRWHKATVGSLLDGAEPDLGGRALDLPMSVEHLGRELGDISQQAVIHLDFNDLGTALRNYRHELSRNGADHLTGLRTVSDQIADLTHGLAKAMITAVANRLQLDETRNPILRGTGAGSVLHPHTHRRRGVRVPVRPIVVAGDDLTVVCDARLAWSLTRFAFAWLDSTPHTHLLTNGDPRRPMAARTAWPWGRTAGLSGTSTETGVPTVKAGIAVQPVGSPLLAAYDISDELCTLAKQHRTAEGATDEHAVAWSRDFDTPERVVRRLTGRHSATGESLNAQPMLGSEFREFLTTCFAPDEPTSLRSTVWADHRSWLLSDLRKLLLDGGMLRPELTRREQLGLPTALPGVRPDSEPDAPTRARLLAALDLLDTHLDIDLAPTVHHEGSTA
ncbi:hypothetical protein F4561_004115 [Lipingzhangella halophila]|uniref:Uncharacterized protein n=1 Tax=Lipingzhangella halophila TaxID=1783352 RepID=A0A7W7RJW1_9ACTN|nr:hypothetical protein [Lipingzhangella halophila]MBB4933295.1 hypothetical protein [Lipingzhangella halophila]